MFPLSDTAHCEEQILNLFKLGNVTNPKLSIFEHYLKIINIILIHNLFILK